MSQSILKDFKNQNIRDALGRAVKHSTSDHWVPGSKPGVFKSGALSSFISLPGAWSVAHTTMAVKEATLNKQFTDLLTHSLKIKINIVRYYRSTKLVIISKFSNDRKLLLINYCIYRSANKHGINVHGSLVGCLLLFHIFPFPLSPILPSFPHSITNSPITNSRIYLFIFFIYLFIFSYSGRELGRIE